MAVYAANPSDFTGKVIRVVDGDTIHVVPDDRNQYPDSKYRKTGFVPVRMRGIDSPEKNQVYGPEARDMLVSLILQETISVVFKNIDQYGRFVGYVFLDGRNINLEMVESGYAWAYMQYVDKPYASEFYNAEQQSRKERKGLWKQSNPIPPWEWRKSAKIERIRK